MADSFVQVNVPSSLGKRFKTFATVDGLGNTVESSAVTLVDADGNEVFHATEATQLDVLAAIRAQDSGVFSGLFVGINGDGMSMVAAMPIAQPTTTLLRATANSGLALATAIGLVVVGAAIALPVRALSQGVLTLPTSGWDAITGDVGGLAPGALYYLDVLPGRLSTAAPVLPGQYVTVIGNAISSVTMLVHPQIPILL